MIKAGHMKPTDLRGMISQSCCQIRSRLFWAEGFFCVCGRRIKDTGVPVHCMGCFRLLDAVQADAETRMETLPEDSEDVHGFGMTLGSLLLKASLQADWKCEMVEDDALWLIGFASAETQPYTMSGLLRKIPADTLMSAKDSTDCTLSDIRLRYYAAHGNELCWRYPISDGIHAGAFILATKDGYLSLPYNSMDEEDYEILVLDDAVFHDLASLTTFLSDWEDFSADLTDAMREMCRILEGGEEDA